ncbi:Tetrathionate response regulatory protein TtrR [Thalassovita gelatinovora]|uniref:Tetrathionate response regulatory protein TtrR n=1 Tax=Thalassovita gelatinovora TaxID=53501 RepID=A0A0P1FB18_THAGE|nr:PAS and helix-turn-helix domain-containing protein [Thalassovita gelatinovora]QIZ80749.1 PAS and helix-turn-helix domain-containing protein [Thalassovita gelatinovora]CUH65387.1 Tetrathionate response regulatory protein TtrR [Thalassovita gelatinovora]SEQ90310.1 PAS domain S-box-containing protein [Thalassovita gelatinovora]
MDDLDQLAFENAPMGLALTEHRVIRSCNDTFARMFGFEKPQLLGQSFRLLYGTDQEFHQIRDIGLEPLKQDMPYSDERLMQKSDGSHVWCRFRARTLTPKDPLARIILSFALIENTPLGPSLTPREREVLMWLARGRTSKEIAQVLNLSPRTIEDVRARLLRKFKVKNVAVLLARMAGFGQGGPAS